MKRSTKNIIVGFILLTVAIVSSVGCITGIPKAISHPGDTGAIQLFVGIAILFLGSTGISRIMKGCDED